MNRHKIASELLRVAESLTGNWRRVSADDFDKYDRLITKLKKEGIKQWKKDVADRTNYAQQAGPWLIEITKSGSNAQKIALKIKEQFPGTPKEMIKKWMREWNSNAKNVPEIVEFAQYIAGKEREAKGLKVVRNLIWGILKINASKKRAITLAEETFQKMVAQEGKQTFEEVGYVDELMKFLPPGLSIEVDSSNNLQSFIQRFGNKVKTWRAKAATSEVIVKHFNKIVSDVKKDMKSSNEEDKLCAIMTAIAIETGLRPARMGNAANVRDPETGEKVEVDTFGIVTMKREHLNFVKDNFAEIKLVGKKGTDNIAFLNDSFLIKELQKVAETVTPEGGSDMLFVTKDGKRVGRKAFGNYVKRKWKGLTPTDFRKLRGTRKFYEAIKSRITDFRKQVIAMAELEEQTMKDEVTSRIVQLLEESIEEARAALSHKGFEETIKSYVDPRVVMAFLSKGGIDDTLEDVILNNKSMNIKFDVHEFVNKALDSAGVSASAVVEISEGKKKSGLSLSNAIDDAIDLLEAIL